MKSDGSSQSRFRVQKSFWSLFLEHLDGMIAAVKDGELWNLWYTSIPSPEKVEEYIRTALDMRENAGAMPFAVLDRESNTMIGCTRYFKVDEINQRLRSAIPGIPKVIREPQQYRVQVFVVVTCVSGTECHRSRISHPPGTTISHWAAIARLGAKQDGVLRNHTRSADGIYRDTVVFSISSGMACSKTILKV